MGLCYESYSGQKYSQKPNAIGKQKIKMHHYVMSFKKGEISAEKAHKIGLEWAKKVFGNNHQILAATHVDTDHIHVHFAVNAYNLNGEHWIDNKKTLKHCRDISDRIMKDHNLSVIEKPKCRRNQKYTEWLARQNCTSWKLKLCDDIDRIILLDNIKTIADLIEELIKCGYTVKQGKYLSVKPSYLENRKPVRTFNLGDGYGLEELQYRIEHKDREMSFDKILKYSGIQRNYALCLRGLQISFNRKEGFFKDVTYGELRKTSDLLCFMSENKIHSRQDFDDTVNKVAEKADELIERYKAIKKKISDYDFVIKNGQRYLEILAKRPLLSADISELAKLNLVKDLGVKTKEDLEKFPKMLEAAQTELSAMEAEYKSAVARKKEVTVHYRAMLDALETDYDRMVREQKAELEKYEEANRPKVPFGQRVTEMAEWAKKVQEQEKLDRQCRDNRNKDGRER